MPSRLVVGDPMPADMPILPAVEELERLHGCSAAEGDTHGLADDGVGVAAPDIPPEQHATVQPPVGSSSPEVTPVGQPSLCPACRGRHSPATDCDTPSEARAQGDLTAVALTIFGDMLEGSA